MAGLRGGEVVVYEAPSGEVRVDVRLDRETVWLSLNQMAELFGRDKSVISRHLRNVFCPGELPRERVVARTATTAADGKTYQVEFFNLNAILSVGYRVKSKRGTQFRISATCTLREHLARGYPRDRQRCTRNAADPEAALSLRRRAATGDALTTAPRARAGRRRCALCPELSPPATLRRGAPHKVEGQPGGMLPAAAEARAAIATLKAPGYVVKRSPGISAAGPAAERNDPTLPRRFDGEWAVSVVTGSVAHAGEDPRARAVGR